jgi:hypothetical protein
MFLSSDWMATVCSLTLYSKTCQTPEFIQEYGRNQKDMLLNSSAKLYREKGRHTDRQTEGQTDRQKKRITVFYLPVLCSSAATQAGRQTGRQTGRQAAR